MTNAQNI